ncbi:alpha/beta hydrolase [Halovulum dunhuangense]|uniref:Alpha/beta hydrolase n=1 Tax=Halovulum dunhuangense TaxID=1505036 RepID=A0A849L1V1_9RHOB|nr:alpha/beta hydrolase [Halovulum dunhuangense]NNU80232.1 alpha/beta hydrolase [Halovulum dunhuangense]
MSQPGGHPMSVLHLSLIRGRVLPHFAPDLPFEMALAAALERLPERAPIVILVHGYRYCPSRRETDPHACLFSTDPASQTPRVLRWPGALGFSRRGLEDGLCIGFGWPAGAQPVTGALPRGFARAYDTAAEAGAALAAIITAIEALAPGRSVDLMAHSLGARVALNAIAALDRPGIGQVILLDGAEYRQRALTLMTGAAAGAAQIFNVSTPENALFDLLLTGFGPLPGARPLSAGLSADLPFAFDLRLGEPVLRPALARRGIAIGPATRPVCHWSVYSRPGAMALYRAILRDRARWSVARLRAETAADRAGTHPDRPDRPQGWQRPVAQT